MPVKYQLQESIALLELNNPPANVLGQASRQALFEALQRACRDDSVKAIVLKGSEQFFCAGADIVEFQKGGTFDAPSLPDLLKHLDTLDKPVVAAISGICMGGGLELALACHYRVAADNAQFALPEVKLGILPGAGGTQRLPRAIGPEQALLWIVSGATYPAGAAVDLGLAEAGGQDVLAVAFERARQAARSQSLPRLRDQITARVPLVPQGAVAAGLSSGLPAPRACLEAVKASIELPFDSGMTHELELFKGLLASPESKGLRHVFFSERAATRVADLPPREIRQTAVIGAGTMGAGIAMCLANAGLSVLLMDQSESAIERGLQVIRKSYEASVKKGKLSLAEFAQRLALITPVTTYAALADVDLVIEAVFESLEVKRQVFQALDEILRPGAILASNTSTLDLNAIAECTRRPEDVIGMHFFSPANVMRLLEVANGRKTAPQVLTTVMRLAKRMGKVGVVSGVCDGFIGNRMIEEYLRQAYQLLEEGALPQQVDQALQNWGMAMGPFAMSDMAGLDIGLAIRKRRLTEQPDRPYSAIPDLICELGRHGQKTSAGFYRYEQGSRVPVADPFIDQLIVDFSQHQGIARRVINDREIVERCILALTNEGATILEEGIARRASDIDTVYVAGYGFPAHRGGPMFHADTLGLENVLARMRQFQQGHQGHFWQPAPLLLELVDQGQQFNSL